MPITEAYKEHIIYTFHAFCKVVIRNAAMTAWRNRSRQRQREISLDYLTEELHYSFGTTDEYFDTYGEYPVVLCGQTVIFTNEQLAAAILSLPERRKEFIYLYYFERHTQQEIGEMYRRCRSTTGYQIRKTLRILHEEMEVLLHEQETKPTAL